MVMVKVPVITGGILAARTATEPLPSSCGRPKRWKTKRTCFLLLGPTPFGSAAYGQRCARRHRRRRRASRSVSSGYFNGVLAAAKRVEADDLTEKAIQQGISAKGGPSCSSKRGLRRRRSSRRQRGLLRALGTRRGRATRWCVVDQKRLGVQGRLGRRHKHLSWPSHGSALGTSK